MQYAQSASDPGCHSRLLSSEMNFLIRPGDGVKREEK